MKTRTFPGSLLFMLALSLVLAGCGREGGEAAQDPAPAPPEVVMAPDDGEDFELAWQGVLPCADCEGIQTRLSLRRDADEAVFELRETYLGAAQGNEFTTTGRWQLEPADEPGAPAVYRLGPEGGSLGFALQPDGSLQLLDADGQPPDPPLAFRLHRL